MSSTPTPCTSTLYQRRLVGELTATVQLELLRNRRKEDVEREAGLVLHEQASPQNPENASEESLGAPTGPTPAFVRAPLEDRLALCDHATGPIMDVASSFPESRVSITFQAGEHPEDGRNSNDCEVRRAA